MGWSILSVTEENSEQYQHLITKLFTHHFSFLNTCVLHTRKCFYAFKGGTHGIELFFKCKDEIGSFVLIQVLILPKNVCLPDTAPFKMKQKCCFFLQKHTKSTKKAPLLLKVYPFLLILDVALIF